MSSGCEAEELAEAAQRDDRAREMDLAIAPQWRDMADQAERVRR